jgi:hypothetical protein
LLESRRRVVGGWRADTRTVCSCFLYSLFLCCVDATVNTRGDTSLLPACDFVLKPSDGTLPKRHRCRKPAVEDVFVNLTAFFASDCLDFWESKYPPQASRLYGGYRPLTRFGDALAPALGLALALSQNFTR